MPTKLTTEQFIKRSNAVHNKFYNYDNVVYTSTNHKVKITCPIHGDFKQRAHDHMSGSGCSQCKTDKLKSIRKIPFEEFVNRATQTHGTTYQYDKLSYCYVDHDVRIICSIHGPFLQRANMHINGAGCPSCSMDKKQVLQISKGLMTISDFTNRANKIHNSRYQYKITLQLFKPTDPISIVCPIHGEFVQKASYHLQGNPCTKCNRQQARAAAQQKFIKNANIRHINKYDYSKVNYISALTPVTITCPLHGDFNQKPNTHLSGHGCKVCGQDNTIKAKTVSFEEFVQRATAIHTAKYSYSNVNYNNLQSDIKITCNIHGEFIQKTSYHLQGNGCQQCGGNVRLTSHMFAQRANAIHVNKYSYNVVKYRNNKTKVNIICPIHGEFNQTPNDHVNNRAGCPTCSHTISHKERYWLDINNVPDAPSNRQVSLKINKKLFKVDGYVPETNTVYEFLGDFWHGNPEVFNPLHINSVTKTTFQQLYDKTINKLLTLSECYNIVFIWEHDWDNMTERLE